jgi:DNA polymerase-3 subunit gamma/tau
MLPTKYRPRSLSEIVGNKTVSDSFIKLVKSDKVPHFMILSGEIGTGKTTFARIFSNIIQTPNASELSEKDLIIIDNESVRECNRDIKEINASDKNGVDDIRELINTSCYKPIKPSIARIFILDEAHQLTTAAQNCLLSFIEELPNHVFFIFCTSQLSKLLPSVRRRAHIFDLIPLRDDGIDDLVTITVEKISTSNCFDHLRIKEKDLEPFLKSIKESRINSPGLVLQALEKYIFGNRSVLSDSDNDPELKELCRGIVSGNLEKVINFFNNNNNNGVALKSMILGYLRKILLDPKSNVQKIRVAKAIKIIVDCSDNPFDLLASSCLACEKFQK